VPDDAGVVIIGEENLFLLLLFFLCYFCF